MSIFEPVTLTWNDEEYTIEPNRVMGLIEVIEDIITLEEVVSKTGNKRGKLSRAFASALRYAGAKVNDEDVFKTMFGSTAGSSISSAVTAILMLMIPPEHLRAETVKKKPAQPRASSKKRT